MGFLIMSGDGHIQEERPNLAGWVYPLHVWALLPLGNWNLGIADEAITATKTAQSVSQDIVFRVLRGNFAEKNVVAPWVTQANAVKHVSDFSSNIDISGDEDPYLLELVEGRHRRNTTVKYENAQRTDT